MSRWLKSVNNLLEQLDGRAGNVAENVEAAESAFNGLIDNVRRSAPVPSESASLSDDDDGHFYEEGEDEEEVVEDKEEVVEDEEHEDKEFESIVDKDKGRRDREEDDDDDEYIEETVHSDNDADNKDYLADIGQGEGGSQGDGDVDCDDELASDALLESGDEDKTLPDEEAVSIGVGPTNPDILGGGVGMDMSMVSDISISEYYTEEEVIEGSQTQVADNMFSADGVADLPPKTPNRQHSARYFRPRLEHYDENNAPVEASKDPESNFTVGNALVDATRSAGTLLECVASDIDQSAQQPRRYVDQCQEQTDAVLLPNISNDEPIATNDTGSKKATGTFPASTYLRTDSVGSKPSSLRRLDSDPPKQPTRQISIPSPKEDIPDVFQPSVNNEAAETKQQTVAAESRKEVADDIETKKLLAKIQSLQSQMKRTSNELKSSQAECKKAKKEADSLSAQLEVANAEIAAHREELHCAGEQMEKERNQLQEEREDLLDEHDEEIEQLKEAHDALFKEQKTQYELMISNLRQQLQNEEQKRIQEGGNWTSDLKSAMERERSALSQLAAVSDEKDKIQKELSELLEQAKLNQTKLDEYLNTAKSAALRERTAEDKLDTAMSMHAQQMAKRQAREAELEQTILDLGAALTKQKNEMNVQAQVRPGTESANYKDQYQRSVEELDATKIQLNEEIQRREALQQQLSEISGERAAEESRALDTQRRYDQKIAELELANSRLSATIREYENKDPSSGVHGGSHAQHHAAEAERYKNGFMRTSEQLLRHQQRAESYKAEILALKGRLQSAINTAEEAEARASNISSLASQSTTQMYEMEGGGIGFSSTTARRRVKGGTNRARGSSTQVRSIRSALRLNPGRVGPAMEQVAGTIDALDKWMVETGAFLRHEPLARFGCLLYFITLHVWSFALVIFHTTEQPHADFGSMDTNPRHWRPR